MRSLPLLLNWTPQAPPAVPATAPSGSLVGWFSAANPPAGLAVERDPARIASCRLVIGSDNWPTHLAARRGVPTVLLLAADADWLLGKQPGKSPWYPALELMPEDDHAALAARLAASG